MDIYKHVSSERNRKSTKKRSQAYFKNGFSSSDDDEEPVNNLLKNVRMPARSKTSTGSQVETNYLDTSESEDYSIGESFSSTDHEVGTNATISGRNVFNFPKGPDKNGITDDSSHENEANCERYMGRMPRQNYQYESGPYNEDGIEYGSKMFKHRDRSLTEVSVQNVNAVFDNGFEDSEDERNASLTFSNHFGETRTSKSYSDTNEEFVSLTYENDFTQSNGVNEFGLEPNDETYKKKIGLDFADLTVKNDLRPKVDTTSLDVENKAFVKESVTDASTPKETNKSSQKPTNETKKNGVSKNKNEQTKLTVSPPEYVKLSSTEELKTSPESSVKKLDTEYLHKTNSAELTSHNVREDIPSKAIESVVGGIDNTSNSSWHDNTLDKEKSDRKTGDPDSIPKNNITTEKTLSAIPFRKTFNSVGIRQEGQTIFQTHLQKNILDSNNSLPSFGDDDLEIDGEASLKLCFAESPAKLPAEIIKKEDKDTGRSSAVDSSSQSPRNESETHAKDKQLPSDEAYCHTCSGCGRKDCDGNFMKLLRAMIKTGQSKGFEIRNVVPDGNCMFASVSDQLQLLGGEEPVLGHMALRQSCTEYLKQHPESEDGTPLYMFIDEHWEEYLEKMGQDGKWGDHLMLHAIANVIKRSIIVINGDNESNWNKIHPQVQEDGEPEPIYLGHVGELHYVSMRPIERTGDETSSSVDLYATEPSLPNIADSSQQQMFKEEYIDPQCNIPSVHLTFLIKQFMPMRTTLRNADSMCHVAFALEVQGEEYTAPRTERQCQFKAIGNIVDGLGSYSDCTDEGEGKGYIADVCMICYNGGVIAHKVSHNSENVDTSDVVVDPSGCHPGYARLYYTDRVTSNGESSKKYLPNKHGFYDDPQYEDQRSSRNPYTIHLHPCRCLGVYSPFWPEEASSWITRTKNKKWPPQHLIDSLVGEGVLYISMPHPTSSYPKTEFQVCFGVAERRLANEALTKEQRYCFIVFRAIVDLSLKDRTLISASHLVCLFFYACETIPEQYWASRTTACILYMLDTLINYLETRNFPNYFVESNNMIDHIADDDIHSLITDLRNTRSQPVVVLYTLAYRNRIENANEVYQAILSDMEDFQKHKSVRQSVIFTLVPTKIKQATKYIELSLYEVAVEIIQEAHEDRLLVSTCEDNIPFVAFVTEVTNSFGLFKQWWLCVYADEKLGTSLSAELSLHHNPMPLKEIFGTELSGRQGDLLIPRPLAEKTLSLCISFYNYYYQKYRTERAVSFLVKGRDIFQQYSKYGVVSDFPIAVDIDDINLNNVFTLYRCLVTNYVMATSSEPLSCGIRLDEIVSEVESICEQVNSDESYTVLLLMYKFLGDTAKIRQINARLDAIDRHRM